MSLQISASLLKQRQTTIRYNWGFRFALWCAALWAFGYQGLDFLVHNELFLGNHFAHLNPYLVGLAIAVVITVMLAIVSIVWVGVNYGLGDWLRTVMNLREGNLLLLASAVVGGAVAWVSYVVTFLLDSGFAVAMVMFYSIIGTVIARYWYSEKVSRRGIFGLIIIALGCLLLYLSQSGASGSDLFIVLGMGIFAGLGWGVEGALASRAMDVIDTNIAMSVRFTYESVIWLIVLVLSLAMGQGEALASTTKVILTTPAAFLMLGFVALCIHFDYLCWYKSFVYCGVGRGLAVSTISSAITVIIGLLFVSTLPSYLAVAAFVLMVLGVFLVFSGQDNRFAALREVDLEPSLHVALSSRPPDRLPLKSQMLTTIAERGRCWDYELAEELIGSDTARKGLFQRQGQRKGKGKGRREHHLRQRLRLYAVEAQAAGLIVALEEGVDEKGYFGYGKLLSNYALTAFGHKRLCAMRLLVPEEPGRLETILGEKTGVAPAQSVACQSLQGEASKSYSRQNSTVTKGVFEMDHNSNMDSPLSVDQSRL